MVRVIQSKLNSPDMFYVEAAGLSTDEKPTANIVTGSLFIEYDVTTEKLNIYIFDEVSGEWKKV